MESYNDGKYILVWFSECKEVYFPWHRRRTKMKWSEARSTNLSVSIQLEMSLGRVYIYPLGNKKIFSFKILRLQEVLVFLTTFPKTGVNALCRRKPYFLVVTNAKMSKLKLFTFVGSFQNYKILTQTKNYSLD